jgi:predicted ArsR family transcriptional regulator
MSDMTDAKRRLVERLKRTDSATAGELAGDLGLTDTAVRQHLEALESAGYVRRSAAEATGRGRPPVRWQLTAAATGVFPDRHAELTVELLDSIRTELGDAALEQVLEARANRQAQHYRHLLAGDLLADRVRRLAEQRSVEGYLAEVVDADGRGQELVLVEHHCPIAAAAHSCGTVCRTELEVFQAALGDDVVVSREQHLLAGDQRCAYRIAQR